MLIEVGGGDGGRDETDVPLPTGDEPHAASNQSIVSPGATLPEGERLAGA